jgi:hypothetical protein
MKTDSDFPSMRIRQAMYQGKSKSYLNTRENPTTLTEKIIAETGPTKKNKQFLLHLLRGFITI